MTARISSSVAVCFITIIMLEAFLLLLNDTGRCLEAITPPENGARPRSAGDAAPARAGEPSA
jgi:hypothetical protein